MKILVCLTVVPDTTSKITIDSSGFNINYEGLTMIIGPYDDYALSRAIELKESDGAQVDILHIGDESSEVTLKKALALGVDNAYRIHSIPTDSTQTAKEIAGFLKTHTYDLVMMGKESIDYNSSLVHHLVGAELNIPVFSPVMKLTFSNNQVHLTTEIANGKAEITVDLPVILGCQEPIAEWKIPNMRGIMLARTKSIEVLAPTQVSNKELISSEQVIKERLRKQISEENAEELIDILKSANIL